MSMAPPASPDECPLIDSMALPVEGAIISEPLSPSPESSRRIANGSPCNSHVPSRLIPIAATSYLERSSAPITDLADSSDTSCSPDRPPRTTPTLILLND